MFDKIHSKSIREFETDYLTEIYLFDEHKLITATDNRNQSHTMKMKYNIE